MILSRYCCQFVGDVRVVVAVVVVQYGHGPVDIVMVHVFGDIDNTVVADGMGVDDCC